MNFLGKGLVLVHFALSLLALSWAAAIFLGMTDWGWREPLKVYETRRPSEFDKRAAALGLAVKALESTRPELKAAGAARAEAARAFPTNHLFYRDELARLRKKSDKHPEPLVVKGPTYKGGDLVLEKPLGKPALAADVQVVILAEDVDGKVATKKVQQITKSLESYEADLQALNEVVKKETKETGDWIARLRAITFQLTGKDDKGMVVKPGLYALIEEEFENHKKARFELEYLQPIWARALEEAELFLERRRRLEITLDGLEKRGKELGYRFPKGK